MMILKKSRIELLLLCCYFFTAFLLLKIENGLIRGGLNIIGFSSIVFLLYVTPVVNKIFVMLISAIVLLFFVFTTSVFTENDVGIGQYLAFYSAFIVCYIFIFGVYGKLYVEFFYKIFYILTMLIFLALIFGQNPGEMFINSRNSISLLLVSIGSIFLLDKRIELNKKSAFLLYFIIFLTCVMSFGRSGIITSFILLLSVFLYFLKEFKLKQVMFFIFSMIVLSSIFLFYYETLYDLRYFDHIKNSGLRDDARELIFKEYFSTLDVFDVFLGADLSKLPIIKSFNSNPHNTYLYLHASFGFLFLFILFFVFMYFFKVLILRDMVSFFTLSAVLIRFSTDSASDISMLSILFVFVMFFYTIKIDFKREKLLN